MKYLLVLAPFIVIALSYVMYREDGNVKKLILSFLLLWAVIILAVMGNIMRAVTPFFLTHLIAIVVAYGATIYYVLKDRLVWLALAAPIVTMLLYLVVVWIGNEHLPGLR